jgi:peroxiredoxin family protein
MEAKKNTFAILDYVLKIRKQRNVILNKCLKAIKLMGLNRIPSTG